MAQRESDFQTELLHQMKAAGWHAFKAAKITMGGVPDIYANAPHRISVWIELKYNNKNLALGLTELQRAFMRREQKVGGKAGWVMLYKGPNYESMYAGHDHSRLVCTPGDLVQTRKRGEKWDLDLMMDHLNA